MPTKFIFLNTWSPVGGPLWEGLESVALLKKVYHWDSLEGFKSPSHFQ